MSDVKDPTSNALAAVQQTGGKLATLPDLSQLAKQLEQSKEYRKQINEHIKTTFTKWDHYYHHHFKQDCKIWHCEDPYHISKKWEITAAAAKKLLGDFLLFPDFKKDEDLIGSFREQTGLVALVCLVYTMEGKFFASGRGSCRVDGFSDENRAIKMAQKRALIDAVKASGLLSDFDMIIAEKENELKSAGTRPNTPPPPQKPQDAPSSVARWCNFCPSKGPYHARTCQNFRSPQAAEVKPDEAIDGEIVSDEPVVNPDDIPDDLGAAI